MITDSTFQLQSVQLLTTWSCYTVLRLAPSPHPQYLLSEMVKVLIQTRMLKTLKYSWRRKNDPKDDIFSGISVNHNGNTSSLEQLPKGCLKFPHVKLHSATVEVLCHMDHHSSIEYISTRSWCTCMKLAWTLSIQLQWPMVWSSIWCFLSSFNSAYPISA